MSGGVTHQTSQPVPLQERGFDHFCFRETEKIYADCPLGKNKEKKIQRKC